MKRDWRRGLELLSLIKNTQFEFAIHKKRLLMWTMPCNKEKSYNQELFIYIKLELQSNLKYFFIFLSPQLSTDKLYINGDDLVLWLLALPRSGHPAKMTPKGQCRMLNEVKKTKNPRVGLKESLFMSLLYAKYENMKQAMCPCQDATEEAIDTPNGEVWWREHHTLWLLCCLRAWTVCYYQGEN